MHDSAFAHLGPICFVFTTWIRGYSSLSLVPPAYGERYLSKPYLIFRGLGRFRVIHLTMPSIPHRLIRRTVQRLANKRRKLTLLSLPNDTLVDLILDHLCVRDIVHLRSV
jgi:hypothetical protein